MQIRYPSFGIRNFSRNTFLVFFAWIVGLVLGVFYLNSIPDISLMRSVCEPRMSIVGLFAILLSPFCISFILIRIFSFVCILPLITLKAFLFMSCLGTLVLCYGNAGWLMIVLMMPSDLVSTFLLLTLWLDTASGVVRSSGYNALAYLVFPALFGCFDYYVISPFVLNLLKY